MSGLREGGYHIRRAGPMDCAAAAALANRLWPGHDLPALERELRPLLTQSAAAIFLAVCGETPVGFAQCQLRQDYVEGASSSPVGYLEGVFVAEPFRRQGLAGELLAACQSWARAQGCREFASDCELDNKSSLAFHLRAGFAEANRIICFIKTL